MQRRVERLARHAGLHHGVHVLAVDGDDLVHLRRDQAQPAIDRQDVASASCRRRRGSAARLLAAPVYDLDHLGRRMGPPPRPGGASGKWDSSWPWWVRTARRWKKRLPKRSASRGRRGAMGRGMVGWGASGVRGRRKISALRRRPLSGTPQAAGEAWHGAGFLLKSTSVPFSSGPRRGMTNASWAACSRARCTGQLQLLAWRHVGNLVRVLGPDVGAAGSSSSICSVSAWAHRIRPMGDSRRPVVFIRPAQVSIWPLWAGWNFSSFNSPPPVGADAGGRTAGRDRNRPPR